MTNETDAIASITGLTREGAKIYGESEPAE